MEKMTNGKNTKYHPSIMIINKANEEDNMNSNHTLPAEVFVFQLQQPMHA